MSEVPLYQGLECGAIRSLSAPGRVTEGGEACVLPFRYCKGGCKDANTPGVFLDACTTLSEETIGAPTREW